MRAILIFCCIILFALPCLADEYTLSPSVPDFQRGDGFMELGSPSNPYIITDQYGREVGEIRSESIDLTPGDGFMEQGSTLNPYVIELDSD